MTDVEWGYYPDGTRYRKYPHRIPFMQMVDVDGETYLRLRQATELGYTDVPVGGVGDIAYPTSLIRRSRTVGGGRLCNTLTASGSNLITLVEYR